MEAMDPREEWAMEDAWAMGGTNPFIFLYLSRMRLEGFSLKS